MTELRINCWSGPRNVSTALMYSWAQRSDTAVVDEPLYAHYLTVTGREHPGVEDVLASQDPDGEAVVGDVMLRPLPDDRPVLFCKQMSHHLVEIDRSFLGRFRNILLTRDPADMLRSLAIQLPDADLADTGLENLVELADAIVAAGDEPIVIDSARLLADPAGVLDRVCQRLGLDFDPAMLSWPAGPKPYDGAWAPHWYHNVHRSTGFGDYHRRTDPLDPRLTEVLERATPLYERLQPYAT